jgi:hypothetical protein
MTSSGMRISRRLHIFPASLLFPQARLYEPRRGVGLPANLLLLQLVALEVFLLHMSDGQT